MSDAIYEKEYREFIGLLKKARKEAGLTQEEVAEKLEKPQSYVSNPSLSENGKYGAKLAFFKI